VQSIAPTLRRDYKLEGSTVGGPCQSVGGTSRGASQKARLSSWASAEQQRLGEFLGAAVAADVHILGLETGGVLRSRFVGRGAVVGAVEILGRRLGGEVRVADRRVVWRLPGVDAASGVQGVTGRFMNQQIGEADKALEMSPGRRAPASEIPPR